MHERALVSATAQHLAALVGERTLTNVTLTTSPETSIGVVEQAWRSATAGTPMGSASVTCVVRQHVLECLDCSREYPGDKLTPCPECGGNGLVVAPAPEVSLEDWIIEEDP